MLDLGSQNKYKINQKSARKQLTMRVMFRLRCWLVLDTFSVEQLNTRTLKIIKMQWFVQLFVYSAVSKLYKSVYKYFPILDVFF